MVRTFVVMYDFSAEEAGELSVKEGERVRGLIGPEPAPEGWMLVQMLESNKGAQNEGYVPADYLQEISIAVMEPESSSEPIMENTFLPTGSNSNPYPDPAPSSSTQMFNEVEETGDIRRRSSQKIDVANEYSHINLLDSNIPFPPPQIESQNEQPPFQPKEVVYDGKEMQLDEPYNPRRIETNANPNVNNTNMSTSSAAPKTSKTSKSIQEKLAKLKMQAKNTKARKFSIGKQSQMLGAPRVPSLTMAAEKENLSELTSLISEYFGRLEGFHVSTMNTFDETLESYGTKLNESVDKSSELVQQLNTLEEIVENELSKWRQINESEKTAEVVQKSKNI